LKKFVFRADCAKRSCRYKPKIRAIYLATGIRADSKPNIQAIGCKSIHSPLLMDTVFSLVPMEPTIPKKKSKTRCGDHPATHYMLKACS
jgi:hypothetical protein